MNEIRLDGRLLAVAGAVPAGSYIVDVGTDHAKLPVYLYGKGLIRGAVASDVAEGPFLRARKTVREQELSANIKTVLTDGLRGLDKYPADCIVIAGMGGILISDILSASPMPRRARLVLQPMTMAHVLRKYLVSSGFFIEKEALAEDGDKIYQIISAVYCGKEENYCDAEFYLGKRNIEKRNENPVIFSSFRKKLEGTLQKKTAAGDGDAQRLLCQIKSLCPERI